MTKLFPKALLFVPCLIWACMAAFNAISLHFIVAGYQFENVYFLIYIPLGISFISGGLNYLSRSMLKVSLAMSVLSAVLCGCYISLEVFVYLLFSHIN
jgi:hypothetical protein